VAAAAAVTFALLVASGGTVGSSATTEPGAPAEVVTLRIASDAATDNPVHTCGIDVLAEELDGWFDVQLFPEAQLGLAGQVMQLVQAGQFEAAMNGPGQLQAFWAPMGIFSAIYVIDDADHFERVWDSDIGDDLRAGLAEEANLAAPLVVWWGTRQMTSNEPIRSPEDLEGVNLRVSPGSEIAITNAEAMGAEPTGGIGFGELYLALQTGVVDAQENPLPAIDDGAFYEVQDYLNLTGHEPSPQFMVVNSDWWESLPEGHRQAFNDAATIARESAFECTLAAEEELLEQWRAEGVWEGGIIEDVDVDAFREAAEPVLLEEYGDVWAELDLYERIRSMSNESSDGDGSTETTES
jgi:tripartite ATP-independent transporter DctP family solute receptor